MDLWDACYLGYFYQIRAALLACPSVDEIVYKNPVIYFACKCGATDILRLLASRGLDFNTMGRHLWCDETLTHAYYTDESLLLLTASANWLPATRYLAEEIHYVIDPEIRAYVERNSERENGEFRSIIPTVAYLQLVILCENFGASRKTASQLYDQPATRELFLKEGVVSEGQIQDLLKKLPGARQRLIRF